MGKGDKNYSPKGHKGDKAFSSRWANDKAKKGREKGDKGADPSAKGKDKGGSKNTEGKSKAALEAQNSFEKEAANAAQSCADGWVSGKIPETIQLARLKYYVKSNFTFFRSVWHDCVTDIDWAWTVRDIAWKNQDNISEWVPPPKPEGSYGLRLGGREPYKGKMTTSPSESRTTPPSGKKKSG